MDKVRFGGKDDPLKKASLTGRTLAETIGQFSNGMSHDDVVNGCASVILSCMRQRYKTRKHAMDMLDRMHALMKEKLDDHYMPGDHGSRKSVFPFDQVIKVPFLGKV